ncbi:protein-arginine deiminase type-1-like [Discoglossus pictus]
MSKGRTIPISSVRTTTDVCLVGQEATIDIYRSVPSGADSFDVRGSSILDVTVIYNPKKIDRPQNGTIWPLSKGVKVVLSPTTPSKSINDCKVKVFYYGSRGKNPLGSALLYLTSVDVSLDVDVNRIGAVTRSVADKDTWTWGPDGKGAILLVNCDQDKDGYLFTDSEDVDLPNYADLKDMSPMVLTADGPDEFFDDHQITLSVSTKDSSKLRVYYIRGKTKIHHVLGAGKLTYSVDRGNSDELQFYVEGLEFPDIDFSGLVYVNLELKNRIEKKEIFTEKVVFRVAPWIMTPNTLKPLEVYVCSVPDNEDFVKTLRACVEKARCRMTICGEVYNRRDRWIQDEIEFGYTEAPHKRLPVVFDSPRDRGLVDFATRKILGPDFGYVTKYPTDSNQINSLDAFGNLEVSPPVTVDGKKYPLGRILYGSGEPKISDRMNKVLRDFLAAQEVQSPVELFSGWLSVGHIDEFMTFVPAPDQKGFRLLLASPNTCLELFREKQDQGHGGTLMFEGLETKQYSIDDVLSDERLTQAAENTQECIDMNRKMLKKELGLTEEDIIDIPMLYIETPTLKMADGFFPNLVNMLVLGKLLVIPKPFGPIIDGKCCIEEKVLSLLEPLGLNCNFIDDFFTYHTLLGDIHCGTNVVRRPSSKKWWEMDN